MVVIEHVGERVEEHLVEKDKIVEDINYSFKQKTCKNNKRQLLKYNNNEGTTVCGEKMNKPIKVYTIVMFKQHSLLIST